MVSTRAQLGCLERTFAQAYEQFVRQERLPCDE